MTREQISQLLEPLISKEEPPFDPPTVEDWNFLQQKFHCDFSNDFVAFMEVIAGYAFPGEMLNVARTGYTNGNDTIGLVYDHESLYGNWPEYLIPFLAIGNGDYFSLDSRESDDSKVYCYSHADHSVSIEGHSFTAWIKVLPAFLSEL